MTTDISHLTLEQKASLLSGRDFWSTKPIDEAGIPSLVLTDGPHGIRRQAGTPTTSGSTTASPRPASPRPSRSAPAGTPRSPRGSAPPSAGKAAPSASRWCSDPA